MGMAWMGAAIFACGMLAGAWAWHRAASGKSPIALPHFGRVDDVAERKPAEPDPRNQV